MSERYFRSKIFDGWIVYQTIEGGYITTKILDASLLKYNNEERSIIKEAVMLEYDQHCQKNNLDNPK